MCIDSTLTGRRFLIGRCKSKRSARRGSNPRWRPAVRPAPAVWAVAAAVLRTAVERAALIQMPVRVSFPSQYISGPVLFVLSRSALDLNFGSAALMRWPLVKFWNGPCNGRSSALACREFCCWSTTIAASNSGRVLVLKVPASFYYASFWIEPQHLLVLLHCWVC